MTPRYVLAVDQSTSASKVFLADAQGEIVRAFSRPHVQRCPAPGCAEQDAEAIYQNVLAGIAAVCEGLETGEIAALGLSNQRETVVLWDRGTGRPLGPAIGWQDVRGEALCRALSQKSEAVRSRTGLSLSPYYPAAKIAAALREAPALREGPARRPSLRRNHGQLSRLSPHRRHALLHRPEQRQPHPALRHPPPGLGRRALPPL